MRATISGAAGVIGVIIVNILVRMNGYRLGRGGFYLAFIIFGIIGFFISEMIIKSKYGNTTGAVQESAANTRIIKYSFMDDKILINEGLNTDSIFYNQIVKVTQNPYYYYIYTANQMFQISKTGFSAAPQEFEKLMNTYGITIGVDFGV